MCFGGGSSRPEPVSPTVTQEQKEQKKEETQKKVERRQEALEKEVTQDTPVKTQLTYEMGAKSGTPVVRGRRGRRALYTSGRGGIGYRNPLMFG
tara:strand:+ start:1725 stop:2006 length:282 start_codon:yes stop_codon:yes gene_type:complete